MKVTHLPKRSIIIITLAILLLNCTGTGVYVGKSSTVGLEMGSPLSGVKPKTFVVGKFTDDRGFEPSLVSSRGYKLQLDKPVTEIVEAAIKRELERNGHKCVSEDRASQADFRITGSVYKYWFTFIRGLGGFVLYSTADVGIKISASQLTPKATDFSKKYSHTQQISSKTMMTPEKEIANLHETFLNTLRDFTTDSDFIAFLSGS